jgi:hypothetical protein
MGVRSRVLQHALAHEVSPISMTDTLRELTIKLNSSSKADKREAINLVLLAVVQLGRGQFTDISKFLLRN